MRIDRNKVREMAEQGKTSSQISRVEKKSRRAVQRVLSKLGMSRPTGRPTLDADWDDVYDKVKSFPPQMSVAQAANLLNCSVRTVQRKFKQIKNARIKQQATRGKR